MSISVTGRATIFGFKGDLTYSGIVSSTDQAFISGDLTADAEMKDFWKDGTGEVLGIGLRDLRRKFTVDFFPVADAAGNTLAHAASSIQLPAIPSKVTLSAMVDATGTSIGPSLAQDWVYHGGGSISYSDGQVKLKLPLEEFTTSGQTATNLTTAAT